MYKVVAFIKRKAGITPEEFRDYYETRHAPLIERLTPKMLAYRRNYLNFAAPFKRDEEHIGFDVVTEMEFADEAACQAWFDAFAAPAVLDQVLEDERNFLDQSRVMVCAVDLESSQ